MLMSMHTVSRLYRKGAKSIPALQNLDLDIAEGEFLAIAGPSGSGKSTLLHLLGCLDRPTAGRYLLDGIDVAELSDSQRSRIRHQKIGFVFQSFHLLPQYSVLQNIEAPLLYDQAYCAQSRKRQGRDRAEKMAARVGLSKRVHHRPSEISGGEMQRTALARALVMNPCVILADEPTGNLDSTSGREIVSLLKELHQQGRTVVLITHDADVAACAGRIIHLRDGCIEREEQRVSPRAGLPKATDRSIIPQAKAGRDRAMPVAFALLDVAIKAVLLHKLRSFLSVLGIVFGIGAIIAMLAVGAGARQEILEQIELLGSNVLLVKALSPADKPLQRGREELSEGLSRADADRIAAVSPSITAIAPLRAVSLSVQYQHKLLQEEIIATSPDYYSSAGLELAEGRFLLPTDLQNARRVCVLGDELRQALFAFRNPIGEMLKIRSDWFRVVGTLKNKAVSEKQHLTTTLGNINRRIIIPLSTSSLLGHAVDSERIQEISMLTRRPDDVATVARLTRSILSRLHHGARDYDIIVPRELLKQSRQTQQIFNIVMSSIAGISLLVGGIGIMNIMLATVSERTREIGIRRAIGADRTMILAQFLLETLVLTTVGGLIGVILGLAGASLIGQLAGWRTLISWQSIPIAVGISVLVGIVFGLYPASQGAAMDPIRALRYE